jgi:hypothetical protein
MVSGKWKDGWMLLTHEHNHTSNKAEKRSLINLQYPQRIEDLCENINDDAVIACMLWWSRAFSLHE